MAPRIYTRVGNRRYKRRATYAGGKKFIVATGRFRGPTKVRGGNNDSVSYKPIRTMAWLGSPFPREMMTQFTYAENFTITSTVGAVYNYLFSANSLFDPNVTGTGIQPRFYDTLVGANSTAAPYQSYRVMSSKIAVEAVDVTDSINARGYLGVGLFTSNQTGPSTLAELRARKDFSCKYMGIYTGGKELPQIKKYGDMKTLFGIKDMKDDEETAAAYNGSPTKAGRWCITYVPFNESSTCTIQVLVKITYYVQLFNRNDVSDS